MSSRPAHRYHPQSDDLLVPKWLASNQFRTRSAQWLSAGAPGRRVDGIPLDEPVRATQSGGYRNVVEVIVSGRVDLGLRPRREGSARVAGGRVVGFAEWGSPDGRPVVAFHGCPGSRLMAVGCEERAAELGLRILCLERPGFGLSEFASDRTVLGWADDVAAATRALDLDRFVVVGVSAGAPYALACGARLPSRVEAVGVIAGIAPPQFLVEDELTTLIGRDRHAAEKAARRHFSAMHTDIDASVRAMASGDGPDRNTYARPEVQERSR